MSQPDQGRSRTSRDRRATGAGPTRSRRSSGGIGGHQPAGGRSAGSGARRGGPARRPRGSSAPARPVARVSPLEAGLAAAQAAPAPEPRSFGELGVPAALVTALHAAGIDQPFAIQSRALPDAMAGCDVLGRAQTGSGKTLAFGIPLLTRLVESGAPGGGVRAPRGLVLVPTRELALQVDTALAPLARSVGLRTVTVYGGAPYGRQIEAFRRGVDVVVATPGRLIDLLDRGVADLSAVTVSVLDEADFMADLGFLPPVRRLLDLTRQGGQRLLFSATLDGGVEKLVTEYLSEPALHAVASAAAPVESMEHRVFSVAREDKIDVAGQIATRPGRTLVFVRTKHGADRLARQLNQRGADATAIHGNLNQNQRQRALSGFAAGSPRTLVATDVAARGIHVDDVDLVVHFDLPADSKDYLHRSGRTARAGAAGTVIAFAQPDEAATVRGLLRDANVDAATTFVAPGHPEVLAVGTTGTAPVPPPAPEPVDAPAGHRRPPRSGRSGQGRPHSGGQRREGGPRGDGSRGEHRSGGARRPRTGADRG